MYGQREAGVDDVLDQHDVAAEHVEVEVLDDPHPAGLRRVGGDGEEVDLGHDPQVPDQVGEERHRALEDRDQHDVVVVGGRDLAGQALARPPAARRPMRAFTASRGPATPWSPAGAWRSSAAGSLPQSAELAQRLDGLGVGLGVALLEHRHHDLLEEAGLAFGGVLVHAQVAGLDAEAHEAGRQVRHHERVLVVVDGAPHGAAREDPVALELGQPVDREARWPAQLLDREVDAGNAGRPARRRVAMADVAGAGDPAGEAWPRRRGGSAPDADGERRARRPRRTRAGP